MVVMYSTGKDLNWFSLCVIWQWISDLSQGTYLLQIIKTYKASGINFILEYYTQK